MITPIFIFSMPRSGSTLLQKILMSHENISSHAEPWFLLNMASMYKYKNVKSDFAYSALHVAVEDMINSFENKEEDLYKYIREFALNVYQNLSDENSIYFIDKTPRYFLIIDFIAKVFPDAKFIFLTRDPLDTIVSYITSFNHNTIASFDQYDTDFNIGFKAIANGYEKYKYRSILVNYEKLVTNNKEKIVSDIFEYLNIENDKSVLENFSNQNLNGSMGDKNINSIKKIVFDEDKWKKTINTNSRKKILLDIIQNIDDSYFDISAIDKKELLSKIKNHKTNFNLLDFKDYQKTKIRRIIKKTINWDRY